MMHTLLQAGGIGDMAQGDGETDLRRQAEQRVGG